MCFHDAVSIFTNGIKKWSGPFTTTTSLLMPSVLFTDDIKSEVAVEKSDAISAQRERRLNHGPFSAARRTSFHCSSFVLTV